MLWKKQIRSLRKKVCWMKERPYAFTRETFMNTILLDDEGRWVLECLSTAHMDVRDSADAVRIAAG